MLSESSMLHIQIFKILFGAHTVRLLKMLPKLELTAYPFHWEVGGVSKQLHGA